MTPRFAFVTIGQAPRPDLVPEMRGWLGDVEIEERGALDGLDRDTIAGMAPGPADHRLVTRLADGAEVVVRKDRIAARLQAVFDGLSGDGLRAIVLLCTGHFQPFAVRGLFLDSQSIVDQSVAAIAHHARTIGLMVPLAAQIDEFHFRPGPGQTMTSSHASPYIAGRLDQAARELASTDIIVMHCMGYTDEMRRTVASVSRRPVLLARRLVAAAVAQLV